MKSKLLLLVVAAAGLVVTGGTCDGPLVPSSVQGPTTWLRGAAAACTTMTTDPKGGQVSYQFDWGDNSRSEWSAFMDGNVAFSDTHTYAEPGQYSIKARARNSKKASGWSTPLDITVTVGQGEALWCLAYTDPTDPEDSSDFSLNTFAIGADSTAYVACDYGALVARKPSGSTWRFVLPGADAFSAAPVIGSDGTVYIGCTNDTVYALNTNGTRKWVYPAQGPVNATAALAADGTVYVQTEDSLVLALNPDGSRKWAFYSHGGNASPVVGADGTIYAANSEGQVYALDPSSGVLKWPGPYTVGSAPINATPALDQSRNTIYVVDDDGQLVSIDVETGAANGPAFAAGDAASSPVIGTDGTVYLGGGGKLHAVAAGGTSKWTFSPPYAGTVSPPALSSSGCVYVLITPGKKKGATDIVDSLYAVNESDGTRRWACGLGEGLADFFMSAPKVDAAGRIYVGDGTRAWCLVGVGGPESSAWPMFQHDLRNSGRAQ